jgi:multicomponent Na+:H+ antiporter subunit G
MNHLMILNLLTTMALIGGLFFLLVGALGVLRFPDIYLRMIAASKCITLGITGMLLAAVFHFTAIGTAAPVEGDNEGASAVAASTKAILVILFQFVAGPVAMYMLARSAHIDRARMWKGTLSDDLADDTAQAPAKR